MTFCQHLQGSFKCHCGSNDCLYSDHPSHYVSPRPGIEPGLTACEASMLPTTPPSASPTNLQMQVTFATNVARVKLTSDAICNHTVNLVRADSTRDVLSMHILELNYSYIN